MSGKVRSSAASRHAALLLGCTMLAGLPNAAWAQDAPGAETAAQEPTVAAPGEPQAAPVEQVEPQAAEQQPADPLPTDQQPDEPQPAGQDPQPSAAPAGSPASPAPVVTPVEEQGEVIRSIAVSGAQRLEPETIVSYIQLRPGDRYTAAAADQALKDLAATELFADFSIRNDGGNVVITV